MGHAIVNRASSGSPQGSSDPNGKSLLELQREYEERLEREKESIRKREQELEERARFQQQVAHANAVMETTKGLTKLRQQQQRQLHMHNSMHKAADTEKMHTAARAVQLAAQQREAMHRAKLETKAEAEAVAAEQLKATEERHAEQMRTLEERLTERWQKRLDDMIEQKRRETARADKLLQERDTARGDAKAARNHAERILKDKEEALRQAQTKSLREKNAAIQMERDKAETARRTAMQAEAVRAAHVNVRSKEADDITQLATQALKVAEEEKKRAEDALKRADADRRLLATAREEAEYLREEARLELAAAKKTKDDAAFRIEKMSEAMNLQNAALEAVRKSASAEKVALMKAAEEAKASALAAVAEEREAEKAQEEAVKAAARAKKELAKKLGVSRDAFKADDDDDEEDDDAGPRGASQSKDPTTTHQTTPGSQSDGARPADASAEEATTSGQLSTKLTLMTEQLESALARAEAEHDAVMAAEKREAELTALIAQLQEDMDAAQTEASKYASLWTQFEALESNMARQQKAAQVEKAAALTRLRAAYSRRLDLKPMSKMEMEHAMTLGTSILAPEQVASKHDSLVSQATVGICAGTRVSQALADIAGFGSGFATDGIADGRPELVHVKIENLGVDNPFDQGGLLWATSGIAVKDTKDEWLIKWVLDAPLDGTDVDESAYGSQQITLASAADGLVLIQGQVEVKARPEAMAPSLRCSYGESAHAVVKLQAAHRGAGARKEIKEKQRLQEAAAQERRAEEQKQAERAARETQENAAATKMQSAQRGRSGRLSAARTGLHKELDRHGLASASGAYFITTKKPLICRQTWSLESERQAEVLPDTRVTILDIHVLDDGIVRALIQHEDGTGPPDGTRGQPLSEPLGWLTAAKEGAKSLWAAPPRVLMED